MIPQREEMRTLGDLERDILGIASIANGESRQLSELSSYNFPVLVKVGWDRRAVSHIGIGGVSKLVRFSYNRG